MGNGDLCYLAGELEAVAFFGEALWRSGFFLSNMDGLGCFDDLNGLFGFVTEQ